jgi:hypothetical protein
MAASAIALLTIIVIAWPLYLFSRQLQLMSRSQYIAAGIAVAGVVAGAVLPILLRTFTPVILESVHNLEIAAVLVVGPAAALVFWSIVRPNRMR